MLYQLKSGQPAFQVVDGPCKGRTYRPGETYQEIPPREAARFDATGAAVRPKRARVSRAKTRPDAGQEGDES